MLFLRNETKPMKGEKNKSFFGELFNIYFHYIAYTLSLYFNQS